MAPRSENENCETVGSIENQAKTGTSSPDAKNRKWTGGTEKNKSCRTGKVNFVDDF